MVSLAHMQDIEAEWIENVLPRFLSVARLSATATLTWDPTVILFWIKLKYRNIKKMRKAREIIPHTQETSVNGWIAMNQQGHARPRPRFYLCKC